MTATARTLLTDPAEFTAALKDGGVDATAIAVDDKGTIAAGSRSGPSHGEQSSRRRLALATTSGDSEIVVTGSLSKGGMGEVMLARQTSLHREVAVKVLKGGGGEGASDLVIEARIAGNLEHPNIVPVHVLGADAEGLPMLVMKRVEGETWRSLLQRGRDLERDLHILMEVCQALHFAHSRGVAHCDVKPTNVMVGAFGEVYLVDWGVAVGFGQCAIADVPLASTMRGVFGTPKYMAPEMALPGGVIDARTDVYIVGAVLYELVTGLPLRGGRRPLEVLLHEAHVSPPPVFGDDVDVELQVICRRALARSAADRFASIDELRLALVEYQRHGAARVLTIEAEVRLEAVRVALRGTRAGQLRIEDDVVIRQLGAECRFGFQTALRAWPSSARARDGLDACLVLLAGFEVDRGELASARALLVDVAHVPSSLTERVVVLATAREAHVARVESLETFAREHDVHAAERERSLFVIAAGLAWLVMTVTLDRLTAHGLFVAGPGVFSIFTGLFAAVFAVGGRVVPVLRETASARALVVTMTATEGGLALVYGIAWFKGIDAASALAVGQTILTITGASFAAHDRRLWPAVALSLASVAPLLVWPERAIVLNGVGCFLALADIARQWRRPQPSAKAR